MGDYSIWALEYAYCREFPKAFAVHGAYNEDPIRFSFGYLLIKGRGHVALVDVGFDDVAYGKELRERFGIENWHSPRDVLSGCGITPEDVTHIFITHAHFDHMGGADLFPNATFYIQQEELSKWVWALTLDRRLRWLTAAIDPQDIMRAVNLAQKGRLVCVDGVREDVLPGIDLYPAHDTHTPGSQYVLVRNDGKRDTADGWILAGDLVYKFDNLLGNEKDDPIYLPIGSASGSQTNLLLAMHEMLGRVGGEAKRVIPIHEARLKDAFPSRLTPHGLHITEITLGAGQSSRVG